ncbi:hypothetical protein GCM10020358_76750 [Amorphoplanes nipponensis]|uniref:hypothetical protein n=1 Tax=Actinoplanes nipponensis TaxID=135950 RepID=UPI0031E51AB5
MPVDPAVDPRDGRRVLAAHDLALVRQVGHLAPAHRPDRGGDLRQLGGVRPVVGLGLHLFGVLPYLGADGPERRQGPEHVVGDRRQRLVRAHVGVAGPDLADAGPAQRLDRVQGLLDRLGDGVAVVRDHAQFAGVAAERRHGRGGGAGLRELVRAPHAVGVVDVVLQILQPLQLVAHRLPASRPAPRASAAS